MFFVLRFQLFSFLGWLRLKEIKKKVTIVSFSLSYIVLSILLPIGVVINNLEPRVHLLMKPLME